MFMRIGSEITFNGEKYIIDEFPTLCHPTRDDKTNTVPAHFTASCHLKSDPSKLFAVFWNLSEKYQKDEEYIRMKEEIGFPCDSDRDVCKTGIAPTV